MHNYEYLFCFWIYMEREGQSILIAIFTLVFLCIMMIILFVIFQKRKNSLLLKQKETEKTL